MPARVTLLLVVLLACAACADGPARSPTDSATPITSRPADPTRECLARQKGGYAGVHQAVQRLTGIALEEPDDVPASAVDKVRSRVTALPDETDPPCDSPLTPLREAVEALRPGELDKAALQRVIIALHRWRAAQRHWHPRIQYEAGNLRVDTSDFCPQLRERVTVTYDVHYRQRSTGREGWILVSIDNRYPRALTIGHHGAARIEGSRSGPVQQHLEWGASSSDYSTAWPDRVGRHMIGGFGRLGPRPLRLRPGGMIVPLRVSTFATIDRLGGWCDLPDAARAG